jgi:conjugative transfer ATPase
MTMDPFSKLSAKIGEGVRDFFLRGSPLGEKPVTADDMRRAYQHHSPIAGYLPWLDIIDDNKLLLEDGRSVAAVFELQPVPTEARSKDFLAQQRNQIRDFITLAFEEHANSPWVVSTYAWLDSAAFVNLTDAIRAHAATVHAQRGVIPDTYSRNFFDNILEPHIGDMARKGGLFLDPLWNDRPWGGSKRKCYLVFYRRHSGISTRRKGMTPEKELDTQCDRVLQILKGAGLNGKRLKGEAIRNWLFRWFNPSPKLTAGDTEAWLRMNPFADDEDAKTAEYDLSNDVMTRDVRSDKSTACWYFDGMPHTVLSVEQMSAVPKVGQLSAERYVSDDETSGANARITCLVDELPEGSVVITHFVVKPQAAVRKHLEKMASQSRGDTPEATAARNDVAHARAQIAQGNKLYPYSIGIALRAATDEEMDDVIMQVETKLAANGLQLIDPEYDQFRLDRYIRFLPGAYDPTLAQVEIRHRLIYAHHLANLLPVYGRSVGTGNPGILGFNRGGEWFTCDPLYQGDRTKNGHLFLFGPTGAGKSATLVWLQMLYTAVHNPRWVVIEAGNSFNLLSEYFKQWGKSVVDIVLRPGMAPSIPPFKPALELVDDNGNLVQSYSKIEEVLEGEAELEAAVKESDPLENVQRDILGEMLIIARLMVTGGESMEEARMSRSDVGLLKAAIINAARSCKLAGKKDCLTEDVIHALNSLRSEKPERAGRISEMVEAMELFIDGFAGELFNRPGDELPDADYIRIEMGTLASGNSNKDKLSVAYISIVNQIVARAQRTQRDGRPTINLTDEAHVITTDKLLAAYLVVLSKLLGRRMGLWLWQATQNMKDYPDDAEKMLAMFEWWMCLYVDQGELANIERFKALTADQKTMLLSTTKAPRRYTEGVVMSDTVQGLFRVVPPGLCLALGQSEKEEKTARGKLMQQHGISELEAAEMIGEQIASGRRRAA